MSAGNKKGACNVVLDPKKIAICGDDASLGGTYILRLTVAQPLQVQFGRFQNGHLVQIPSGEMLYLGSALRGLASRVLRHAMRTEGKPKQALFEPLRIKLEEKGLLHGRFRPPTQKKLHWHIDYLLDETAVSLTHAILIRSPQKLEYELGEWLLAQPETAVLVLGLGASDIKGHSHLLQIKSNPDLFWRDLTNSWGRRANGDVSTSVSL